MRRFPLAVLLSLLLVRAAAAEEPSPSSSAADHPLPPLPALAPIEQPAARAPDLQALDARLDALEQRVVQHPVEPSVDFGFLLDGLDDTAVPAAAQRLDELRRSLAGGAATALLDRARREGARALDTRPGHGNEDGDWLQFVLALRRPNDPAWRDLVRLYGMLRMLEAIGSTPAVREMLDAYGYFGELVRIDLQRSLERMKDKAVPALIEARQHDARKVRDWAARVLDALGRTIPGEAIATADPSTLPDVLLAFGRVRDVDATRVILSFVASDRIQLRNAARQALVAIGDAGVWHVRDAYETITGEKPSRGWDHKRLLQELFRVHDRAGLKAAHARMDEGLALANRGDHAAAVAAFDQVLARAPLFERRADMVPSYVARAQALEREGQVEEALLLLRKALRLDPGSRNASRLESRVATLEGRLLSERGTPDAFVLKRAAELDPENDEARERLARIGNPGGATVSGILRRVAAGAVAIGAIVALVALRRRREAAEGRQPTSSTGISDAQNDETDGPGSPPSESSASTGSEPG